VLFALHRSFDNVCIASILVRAVLLAVAILSGVRRETVVGNQDHRHEEGSQHLFTRLRSLPNPHQAT
jgi:hypothetical protein